MGTHRLLALVLLGGAATCAGDTFDGLVANLKSPTARTRQEAARQLGESRRREAVGPLSMLLRDDDPRVRLQMVQALAALRDVSGVPTLVTALEDGDRRVRDAAISAIVEIYADRARSGPISRFLGLFSDEAPRASIPPFTDVDPSVFRALSRALTDEDAASDGRGLRDRHPRRWQLDPGPRKALSDPSADVRAAAAAALGKTGTPAEGRALIPLLADSPPPSGTGRCRRSVSCASRRRGRRCGSCSSRTAAGTSARARSRRSRGRAIPPRPTSCASC